LFLSDNGVYGANFQDLYNLRGNEVPLSESINNTMQFINKDLWDKSSGVYFDNRYYLAIPLNEETVTVDSEGNVSAEITRAQFNNRIIIYNFLNEQWESVDNIGDSNFEYKKLIVAGDGENRGVYILSTNGGIHRLDVLDQGNDRVITEVATGSEDLVTTPSIEGEMVTRMFTNQTIDRKKWNNFEMQVQSHIDLKSDFFITGITENVDDTIDLKQLSSYLNNELLTEDEDVSIRGRILNTTQVYNAADVVTHTNLNNIIGGTTFVSGSGGATDDISLEVHSGGSLQIKDDGVTTSKILDANVTKAKLEDISAPLRLLGRTTAGAGAPEEVTVNDDDDLSLASDITLATDESIKAYVDSLTNSLKPNIVQSVKTDKQVDTSQNIWKDVTDLEVSITPRFANSKILVEAMVSSSTNTTNYGVSFKLVRDDTTDIAIGDAEDNRTRVSFTGGYSGQFSIPNNGMKFLDDPTLEVGTPVTYKVQFYLQGSNKVYINRSNTDTNHDYISRPISTLTVSEIYQ
jgi:hypothetical protein